MSPAVSSSNVQKNRLSNSSAVMEATKVETKGHVRGQQYIRQCSYFPLSPYPSKFNAIALVGLMTPHFKPANKKKKTKKKKK